LSIQTFNETKQGGKRWQKEEQLNHNWAQQAGQFSVQLVGQIWMQFNRLTQKAAADELQVSLSTIKRLWNKAA
ncbi:MAG: hypothetical protein Q7L19_10395, partial [Pseudohongiella sp.]|nr:hypothetical protein [Pseudohongiella sp.]